MATPLQAISKAATPPAASSIGQLAATKKALKQPAPSMESQGFQKVDSHWPYLPPVGVDGPPAPAGLTAHQQATLEKAASEGILSKTESGQFSYPEDPNTPLAAEMLQTEAQSLSDMYGVLGDMPVVPFSPSGWDSTATPPADSWATPEWFADKQKKADDAKRQSGEGIREYVVRLREMAKSDDTRGFAVPQVEAMESRLVDDLRAGRIRGGPAAITASDAAMRDYIGYLAASGVDQRTLDAIADGTLDMSPTARMDRASQMGLDPKAIWHRWDTPLKTEMRGYTAAALSQPEFKRKKQGVMSFIDLKPDKEGLVYTSHSPAWAKEGVQMPSTEVVLYPLLGPKDGIAGLDSMPPSAYDAFKKKQSEALLKKYPTDSQVDARARRESQRSSNLAESLVDPGNLEFWHAPREHNMRELSKIDPVSSTREYTTVPGFKRAEDRKLYTEPLMASGAKGTLVRDETGISTAFTPAGAKTLRRADLAPMDTRFAKARNLLQSLLAPIVVAGAADAVNNSGRK